MKPGIIRSTALSITAALLAAVLMLGSVPSTSAQTEAPVLSINSVDSASFPIVVTTLSVTNTLGSPVTGLLPGDFTITEEGRVVPGENISLETVQGAPLSLVIALDVSVDWQSFNTVREGVKELVSSLGPDDLAAIVTFGETAELAQDYTPDKTQLNNTLDTLVATGVFTALNDAAIQAVNVATVAPTTNRAVLLITNSGDRTGDSSATDAVTQAQAGTIPIYTVGYGPNAATSALEEISRSTTAQSFDYNTAEEAGDGLASAFASTRDLKYQLTFTSSLPADNLSHAATIALTQEGITAETSTTFVAVSNVIGVVVPGIEDGQTVVGKVFLVAEVSAVTTINSVEYLLNGQSIANVGAPPYSFEWDSTTVNPGTYQLTVRATDVAGNLGERTIIVNVSLPFSVQITAPTDRAQVGDDVSIDAVVDTPAHVIQVDMLVDGQVIASDTSKPYSFTFNTQPFDAGSHTVTVRATDLLGRTAESSLPMRFTEAWAPIVIRWAFAALIAIAILVTFLIGIGIMRTIWRNNKGLLYRTIFIELANSGNTSTRYELRADDSNSALTFEFGLNGTPLTLRQVVDTQAGPATSGAAGAAKTAVSAPAPTSSPAIGGGPGKNKDGVVGKVKSVSRFGSMIGNIFTTVGYLIPGSIGMSITSFGYSLSGGDVAINRVEQETNQVKYMSQEVADATGKVTGSKPKPAADTTTTTKTTTTSVGGSATRTVTATTTTTNVVPGLVRMWAQTPAVDPGQTLGVNLTMRPTKGQGGQQYLFRVVSQPVEAADTTPVIEQGNITIKGISIFRRILPFFVLIATLGLMALLVALLAFTIGLLG